MKKKMFNEEGEKTYPITAKHFAVYQEECEYWLKYFGITEYEVFYEQEEDANYRAMCSGAQRESKILSFSIATEWTNCNPTDRRIRMVAFHEVCEALLMRFFILAIERTVSEKDLIEENHTVIRRLENSVFKDSYLARFSKKKKR